MVKKEIEKMKKNANGNNYVTKSVVKDLIKFVLKKIPGFNNKKRFINLTFKPNYPRRFFGRYNV